jgi:hypothetical protein
MKNIAKKDVKALCAFTSFFASYFPFLGEGGIRGMGIGEK